MPPQPPGDAYYLVKGRYDTGRTYDRLEIECLQKQTQQFTLFILALLKLQGHDQQVQSVVDVAAGPHAGAPEEIVSGPQLPINPGDVPPPAMYMHVAGIHGLPYKEYPGDPRPASERGSDYNTGDKKDTLPIPSRFGGYCNHGSVLFPTWHRPYILLVEQAIGGVATSIASNLEMHNPNQDGRWIRAAKELRLPFWDWTSTAVKKNGLPEVLYLNKVEITLPNGSTERVDNPLAYYNFPDGKPPEGSRRVTNPETGAEAFFDKWPRTFRHAASSENPSDSNNEELIEVLKCNADCLREQVARLFTFDSDCDSAHAWDEFSNHTSESLDTHHIGSLEHVHDQIHNFVGGNGHMSDPDQAGFDPIFWLHHANIDRLFALWEYCYPDYWMGDFYTDKYGNRFPWTQSMGTYVQVYNQCIVEKSPLAPFRNGEGNYWTPKETRFLGSDSYPKYYSYPEVAGVKVDVPATLDEREAARKRLQKHFMLEEPPTETDACAHPLFATPTQPPREGYVVVPSFRPFTAIVELPEHAYGHSYSFKLYLETPDARTYVGAVSVFARPSRSPCAACAVRRRAGTTIRGIIPITHSSMQGLIGDTHASVDHAVESVKQCLVGVLVDAGNRQLGRAQGGHHAPRVAEHMAIAPHAAPVRIALWSAATAHHPGGPRMMFDWKDHGEIFPMGWQRAPN